MVNTFRIKFLFIIVFLSSIGIVSFVEAQAAEVCTLPPLPPGSGEEEECNCGTECIDFECQGDTGVYRYLCWSRDIGRGPGTGDEGPDREGCISTERVFRLNPDRQCTCGNGEFDPDNEDEQCDLSGGGNVVEQCEESLEQDIPPEAEPLLVCQNCNCVFQPNGIAFMCCEDDEGFPAICNLDGGFINSCDWQRNGCECDLNADMDIMDRTCPGCIEGGGGPMCGITGTQEVCDADNNMCQSLFCNSRGPDTDGFTCYKPNDESGPLWGQDLPQVETACSDGFDNDCDGCFDRGDSDCPDYDPDLCVMGGECEFTDAYWEDENGVEIPNRGVVEENTVVNLVVEGPKHNSLPDYIDHLHTFHQYHLE